MTQIEPCAKYCAMKTILKLLVLGCLLTSCQTTLIPMKKDSVVAIRTTAYCVNEWDHKPYGNKSALGTRLVPYKSAACDWSKFPVGTKIKIGNYVVEIDDYGSFTTNDKNKPIPTIDVFQPSRSAMNKWGVRYFDNAKVIEWGSYEKSLEILKQNEQQKHVKMMITQIEQKL